MNWRYRPTAAGHCPDRISPKLPFIGCGTLRYAEAENGCIHSCFFFNRGSCVKTAAFLALLYLSGVACQARASNTRLASAQVSSLGNTAASNAGYDVKKFYGTTPFFDPILRIWSVRYTQWDEKHVSTLPATFTVVVYDKSSRTEVSCLGISGIDYRAAIDESTTPPEIKPFVPAGTFAVQIDCVDLNGDGRPDYLVVVHAETQSELMILVRQPDGKLSLQGANTHVAWGEALGGANGSYAVRARRSGFTVDNWSGSGGLGGGDRYDFQYSRKLKTWILVRTVTTMQTGQPEDATAKPTIRTVKDFGLVKFDDFLPE
jgi:hypothetical protein